MFYVVQIQFGIQHFSFIAALSKWGISNREVQGCSCAKVAKPSEIIDTYTILCNLTDRPMDKKILNRYS